jgi:hypothetical protein
MGWSRSRRLVAAAACAGRGRGGLVVLGAGKQLVFVEVVFTSPGRGEKRTDEPRQVAFEPACIVSLWWGIVRRRRKMRKVIESMSE